MRNNYTWVRFNNKYSSEDFGSVVIGEVVRPTYELRGKSFTAAGRDGDIFATDNVYDVCDVKYTLLVPGDKLTDVLSWLRGSGWLELSYFHGLKWKARVQKKPEVKFKIPSNSRSNVAGQRYEVVVTFTCQPFAYDALRDDSLTFTDPIRSQVWAAGNMPSQPKVEIYGKGTSNLAFDLTIGAQTMRFQNVPRKQSGQWGIVVDSEILDAMGLDGTPLNNCVSGDYFIFPPLRKELAEDTRVVTWSVSSGQIDKVVITPRWRYY